MKKMYIDCSMGAAGDMLTAALLELTGAADEYIKKLNEAGVPGVEYIREPAEQQGIKGSHVRVEITDGSGQTVSEEDILEREEQSPDHHHHHHQHRSLAEVLAIIGVIGAESTDDVLIKARTDAVGVYEILAEAESRAHHESVTEIHFHEVGMMDAIADIFAVCYLMRSLSPDRVYVSPVNLGNGTVKCAHGVLPVPAPATALLLDGAPTYLADKGEFGELCTPTGAVLLRYWADEFAEKPEGEYSKTGHGMGCKIFADAVNCVTISM